MYKFIKGSLLIFLIISSAQLYAQDSLTVGKFIEIKLKNGEVVAGKVIEREASYTKLQLDDGRTVKIHDSFISPPDSTSQKVKYAVSVKTIDLELKDGKLIRGKITSVSDTSIIIKTPDDIIMIIPVSQIRRVEEPKGESAGVNVYSKDPNQSHLFFGPTAEPIEGGQVSFSDYMVFFPTLSGGIDNVISIGGGVSLLPNATAQLFYLGIKATFLNKTFEGNNLCLAAGGMVANITNGYGEAQFVYYGAATFSRSIFAFTLGVINTASSNSGNSTGLLLLGGELRVSSSAKLISEDYFTFLNGSGLYSIGIRFFGDKVAGDFGLFTTAEFLNGNTFPFVPWLGFTYNF